MAEKRKIPIYPHRVRELRENRNLTQEQFAEKIDIATNTLSRIERKEMSLSSDIAMKIAKEYHVSLDWLFLRSNEELTTSDNEILDEAFDCMKEIEIVE